MSRPFNFAKLPQNVIIIQETKSKKESHSALRSKDNYIKYYDYDQCKYLILITGFATEK